jgi:hypothetical protein
MGEDLRLEIQGTALAFPGAKPFCLVCGKRPEGTKRVWFEELPADGAALAGGMVGRAAELAGGVKAIAGRITFDAPLCGVHRGRALLLGLGAVLAMLAAVGTIIGVSILTKSWKLSKSMDTALAVGPALVPGLAGYLLWRKKDRAGLPCEARREGPSGLVLRYPIRAPITNT